MEVVLDLERGCNAFIGDDRAMSQAGVLAILLSTAFILVFSLAVFVLAAG